MRGMDDVETRTVMTLRTGTKICVLVGLGLIVLAVYFFIVPITSVRTTSGAVFGCGTALHPSTGGFADGVCGQIAAVTRYKAIAALVAAVLVVVLGGLMFGVDRREEQRRIPRGDYDEDRRRGDYDREQDREPREEDRAERGATRSDDSTAHDDSRRAAFRAPRRDDLRPETDSHPQYDREQRYERGYDDQSDFRRDRREFRTRSHRDEDR